MERSADLKSSSEVGDSSPGANRTNLAARFRPNGLCLFVLRPDGQVVFHDSQASLFFDRFVLPSLSKDSRLLELIRGMNAASDISVHACPGGVLIAAVPWVEKREFTSVFLLAAKSTEFEFNAQTQSLRASLGLDEHAFRQDAASLPSYTSQSLLAQARLLLAMAADQFQLTGLQAEINGLSSELANSYEELSLIYHVSSGMRVNPSARRDDFFKQACIAVLEVMGVQALGVAFCGEQAMQQQSVAYGPLNLPDQTVQCLTTELAPLLRDRGGLLLINDITKESGLSCLDGQIRRILAVPMQRQDQMLGFFFALDKIAGDFDSQDSKLLNSISNESAIYLENAMLFDDVHGLVMGLLHSLTSAVDAKDPYTLGHSERVAALGRHLTIEAGLGEQLAERVYIAGLLHDVGKIGVPESVLQKTGRLTPEEFEQMKKHPQIGAHILSDVKQIRDLIPGVLHHHERYDGNGYPNGLAGENIPLMGRLICLADCFDAMTSNRTYRKAMPLEVALTEIRRCAGTQFDPALTEAFLRIGADKLRELVLSPKKVLGTTTQIPGLFAA